MCFCFQKEKQRKYAIVHKSQFVEVSSLYDFPCDTSQARMISGTLY